MHRLNVTPAKPVTSKLSALRGLGGIRMQRRSLFSTFALLTLCFVALHSLPLTASEWTRDGKIATTTKLKASAKTVKEGSKLTMTATVSPSKATGTVALYGSPGPGLPYHKLVTHTVVAGVATAIAIHLIDVSGHVTFKAIYSGSKVYNTSTSNVVPVDVTK